MDIDNPQVVKFANEGLRTVADKLAVAYWAAKLLVESYDAQQLVTIMPDDPQFNTLIADGSDADGRPRLSVGGLKLTLENIRALLAQLESTQTPSGLSLVQGILSISPRYNG